jgi:hypothetical protein
MIVIAEIFVFCAPFEAHELIHSKIRKLESSLGDFCEGVLWVVDNEFEWRRDGGVTITIPNYTLQYTRKDWSTPDHHLSNLETKDTSVQVEELKNIWSFDPIISLKISITPGSFNPEILGTIISEISNIFKGNFYDQFFVEVASEYPLAQYARGNDLNLQKLESFDLDRPNSIKNKNTLNHLLYLRHQLHRNLLRSLRLRKDIDSAKGDAILPLDGASNLALFAGRMSSIEKSLYARMIDIEKIITHFISLL